MKDKKRYVYKFGKYVYVIWALLGLCDVPFIILSILRLIGVGTLVAYYPALDVMCIAFGILLLAFYSLCILLQQYTIDEKYLRLRGIVIHFKIDVSRVFKILEKDSMLIVFYFLSDVGEEFNYAVINIKGEQRKAFIIDLKEANSSVIYEKEDDKNETVISDKQ